MKLSMAEKQILIPQIERVLSTGEAWDDDTLHFPAGAAIDAVMTIKGVSKKKTEKGNGEGFETNGWSYDWWQKFVYKGKSYTLGGSGYYGGHTFNLSDD